MIKSSQPDPIVGELMANVSRWPFSTSGLLNRNEASWSIYVGVDMIKTGDCIRRHDELHVEY